ncbi:MAG: hypothetical protein J0I19_15945 [Alphaproteobacteria bacterium]|nr:hypothetical protein [Alphaproteobacteria bacterium]
MTDITNPLSIAEVRGETHAAAWQPKPASNSSMGAAAYERPRYASVTLGEDGQASHSSVGGVSRTTNEAIASEASRAASMPYTQAIDSRGNHVAPHQVTDDTRITLLGVGEVTVAQAKSAGFLPHNWSATGSNQLEQARQDRNRQDAMDTPFIENKAPTPEVHPELKMEPFADNAVEQDFSSLVNNVGGFEQMEAVQQIVEAGSVSDKTLGDIASQLGQEPGQVSERVSTIMAAAEKQARSVMSAGGLDSSEVVAWAKSHAPDKLNRAMHKHATQRNTSGYAELRNGYLENLGELNPQAAMSADLGPGNTTYLDKGRVIVRLANGQTMTWRSAIQAFAHKA